METERLILRRWNESDADDLYRYASDPDVGPIAGWPAHKSADESRDVIKNVFNGKEAYAIALKENDKPIGAIELKLNGHTNMTECDDECELGYWLGKPFWGQGIMPEAVNEILRHAFEDCGMQKVWCGYYEGNDKSRRVQEKCGFIYQWKKENIDVPLMHEKRTEYVNLLTREDWEHKLYLKQLKPYLYLMDEAHEATGYIVVGKEKVCVIDTMNGYNDLSKVVKTITDKPIIVVNTHGHPDHIFGNIYFDEAYMNPRDFAMADSFINDPESIEFCKKKNHTFPHFKPIKGGDVIDIGGKTLEVFDLPGHTPGGILLLLKEDRILFTGDSVNHHLWMQLDGCSKLDEYVKELDKVMFLEKEADLILHGHATDFDDISLMRCLRKGLIEICQGKTENDQPYTWFGGVDKQHSFELEEGKIYQQKESVICYR